MRLPLNFLLYLGSLGLIGQAGLWIYQASDKLGAPAGSSLTKQGQDTAVERVANGKGQGPATVSWAYDHPEWWQLFKTANFTGKLPPKPVDPKAVVDDKPKALDVRPLEEIIELVTLVCDGDGARTHVVVRYKTAANVKPPEDVLRQMAVATAAPTRDVAPASPIKPPAAGQPKPAPGSSAVKPTSQLPINTGPREYMQQVKVGDALWEPFTDIKLVAVSNDAEIATFSRKVPGAKPGDPPAERQDQLVRTVMGIGQDAMRAIINARGGGSAAGKGVTQNQPAAGQKWVETEETKKIDNTWHIGTNDVKQYQESRDTLLESVNLEAYSSPFGDLRGVRVANIDSGLSQRYGVQAGDVLLDVNGEKVRSRADALQVGQQQYNRGVRTFDVHFLSNGQVVTRTYQAPDRH